MTLRQIRDLIDSSSADDPLLEQKVIQAKDFIRQNFAEASEEFEKVAIQPSKIESNYAWPGGSKSEFDRFVAESIKVQRQNVESQREKVVAFLDDLLNAA